MGRAQPAVGGLGTSPHLFPSEFDGLGQVNSLFHILPVKCSAWTGFLVYDFFLVLKFLNL